MMVKRQLNGPSVIELEALPDVDKRTLDERVYDQLRDAIMSGDFRPGHVVTLRGLAQGFGTSLMPVRNAISRLTMENALVALPNRSISLPRLTVSEFDEITEIRISLEALATRRATLAMSAEEIDRLDVLNERMAQASGPEYFQLNREFHFTIYAAAERPVLFRLIQGAWLRVGPLLNSLEAHATELASVKHDWTINALRRRDPDDAAASIETDLRSAAHVLRKLIKQAEEGATSLSDQPPDGAKASRKRSAKKSSQPADGDWQAT